VFKFRQFIKKILPEPLLKFCYFFRNIFVRKYRKSYSQSGEDMILNTIFYNVKKGFYVDVGANNPTVQSNTHFFYKKKWSGINIDAYPGSMKKFNRLRRRDINLEIPVSDKEERLNFYMFSSSFYNSFLEESAIKFKDMLVKTKELHTKKLSWIFDNYLNNNQIDFLSIDVEGLDFNVLKSNDWIKYRPKVLLIELFADNAKTIESSNIGYFLADKGYSLHCITPTNILFIENSFKKIRFGTGKNLN
jgi:FkbM family methyltransferase